MYNQKIRILLIDDDEDDRLITSDLLSEIEGQKYELDWVSKYDDALKAMTRDEHDIYLLDYRLGKRTGLELLYSVRERGCNGPIILLTGQGDREIDVDSMKAGASDYLVKSRLDSDLLERSIRYSLERRYAQKEQERLIGELKAAMAEIKTLNGMLPICASCKMIRDDGGYWNQLEAYIKEHSSAEFSHSICPDCVKQLYPELKVSEEATSHSPTK